MFFFPSTNKYLLSHDVTFFENQSLYPTNPTGGGGGGVGCVGEE